MLKKMLMGLGLKKKKAILIIISAVLIFLLIKASMITAGENSYVLSMMR